MADDNIKPTQPSPSLLPVNHRHKEKHREKKNNPEQQQDDDNEQTNHPPSSGLFDEYV